MTRPSVRGTRRTGCVFTAWAVACLLTVTTASILGFGCARRGSDARDQITLRIGLGTGGSGQTDSLTAIAQLLSLEPLLSVGSDGRPVNRLIDRYVWEDEGRTLRLHLLSGVTFHNGHPLTSAAAAAAIEQGMTDLKKVGGAIGFDNLQSIETPTGSEVLLRLTKPDSFVLNGLSDILIFDPHDRIIEGTEFGIGTGPFKVTSIGSQLKTKRHTGYYQGIPSIDEIQVVPYESPRSAWGALMRREVSMLQAVASDSVEFLENVSDIGTFSSVRSFYMFLGFNLRHPVLKQVEVRRALTQAINRERIVQGALHGRAQVANDPIWPFHWAYGTGGGRYPYDTDAARARLDSAGLPVQNAPSPRSMPSRFRFTCLFWSEDPQFERVGMMLQRDLAEVGVDMILEPVTDRRALARRLGAGNFEAFVFQTNGGRAFDRLYQLWHSSKVGVPMMMDTGYDGADQALERLRAPLLEPDLRLAVTDLQARFYEDAPAVFLAWPEAIRAADKQFRIVEPDNPDVFTYAGRWRRNSGTVASK